MPPKYKTSVEWGVITSKSGKRLCYLAQDCKISSDIRFCANDFKCTTNNQTTPQILEKDLSNKKISHWRDVVVSYVRMGEEMSDVQTHTWDLLYMYGSILLGQWLAEYHVVHNILDLIKYNTSHLQSWNVLCGSLQLELQGNNHKISIYMTIQESGLRDKNMWSFKLLGMFRETAMVKRNRNVKFKPAVQTIGSSSVAFTKSVICG